LEKSTDPLKNNICVLILMGQLDIHLKIPEFFTENNFDSLKKKLLNARSDHLFEFEFTQLLTIEKTKLNMTYIQEQSSNMISNIEIFFGSHFGLGKILNPSEKTQEIIMSLLINLKNEHLHSNLEKLFNSFIGKKK
jgi:hypothetical protein